MRLVFYLSFLFVSFSVFFLSVPYSFAQQGGYDAYSISMSEPYPSPGEEVTFTIQQGSSPTANIRSVRWYVNGEERDAYANNLKMIEIGSGTPKQIVANIVYFDIFGQRRYVQVSRWMRSVIFDILWEGDSVTTPRYRGHLLAGPGVPIRISAKIQYIDLNGNVYTEKDFSFRWEIESTFHDEEGPGVSTITYEKGGDYLNNFVFVRSHARLINSPDTAFEEIISIPVTEPRLLSYSYQLLYGLSSELAISQESVLTEQPFTVSVYPFYFSRSDFEKNAIQYRWFVNNSPDPVKEGRKIDFSIEGKRVSIPILISAENENNSLQKADYRFSFSL